MYKVEKIESQDVETIWKRTILKQSIESNDKIGYSLIKDIANHWEDKMHNINKDDLNFRIIIRGFNEDEDTDEPYILKELEHPFKEQKSMKKLSFDYILITIMVNVKQKYNSEKIFLVKV